MRRLAGSIPAVGINFLNILFFFVFYQFLFLLASRAFGYFAPMPVVCGFVECSSRCVVEKDGAKELAVVGGTANLVGP